MEILLYLLLPLRLFAFQPWLTGAVAAAFTALTFARRYGTGSRVWFGLTALAWWAFTGVEATTPVQANIRIDLFILGPVYLGTAAIALYLAWRGRRRGSSSP